MNDATVTIYRGDVALTVFAVHEASWQIVMVLDEYGAGVVLAPSDVEQAFGLIEIAASLNDLYLFPLTVHL